jgi:hypothetical protein
MAMMSWQCRDCGAGGGRALGVPAKGGSTSTQWAHGRQASSASCCCQRATTAQAEHTGVWLTWEVHLPAATAQQERFQARQTQPRAHQTRAAAE